MTDSAHNEPTAFDNALSQVMGTVEDSQEQPETATTDEEVTQPEPEETEEEVEVEDSDEEQPEAEADDEDEAGEVEDEGGSDDDAVFEIDGEPLTRKQIRELRDTQKNLQAGYTKKFQKLSETQKQVDQKFEQADATLQFLENQLKGPLQHFEGIDWQSLQANDPAKYQQLHGQYKQALQGFQQVEQSRKQLQDKLTKDREQLQKQKAREAVESLQDMHSDWNNDLYHQVLEYAVESGVPQEEIASETRPWVISALLKQMRSEKAQKVETKPKPQSVKKTIKQKATTKPRSEAQKRADQRKSLEAKARKGDRHAQSQLNQSVAESEVNRLLGI